METYWITGHVEVFDDGGKINLKAAVQLTAVSINLTVARIGILFTYKLYDPLQQRFLFRVYFNNIISIF